MRTRIANRPHAGFTLIELLVDIRVVARLITPRSQEVVTDD